MNAAWIVLGVAIAAAVGGLIYGVMHAARLKATTDALQAELRQFKEGGFDRLVGDKLAVFTQRAVQELESRERMIHDLEAKRLQSETRASDAMQRFKEDFGAVKAQIAGLAELQGKVTELNDLLKPQQFRGELGEVIVRALIADKLAPGQFEENFTFGDGKQVEFAIRLNGRLIAVDSKLPLDDFKRMRELTDERLRQTCRTDFKRTIKKKIDEVKAYIRPEEGTYNFALMVIPSEAVYYELIAGKDFTEAGGLDEYARHRNVFLTSPTTFWAYLTAIAHGLRGMEIERHAEQILLNLQTLATKIQSFSQDDFQKLGGHLKNAVNKYDEAERKLRGIQDGLGSLERAEAKLLEQVGDARVGDTQVGATQVVG